MSNQYDISKMMLNRLREAVEYNKVSNDGVDITGSELASEQNKFKDQITPRVDFSVFKIYPSENNAVFSGKFQDMNGMEFQFSLEDNEGLYINSTNLQLTDEAIDRLRALKGYYKNWANEWAIKLANEYKQ